eukprot:1571228-Pleurochrysis_carterae.AAC.4
MRAARQAAALPAGYQTLAWRELEVELLQHMRQAHEQCGTVAQAVVAAASLMPQAANIADPAPLSAET